MRPILLLYALFITLAIVMSLVTASTPPSVSWGVSLGSTTGIIASWCYLSYTARKWLYPKKWQCKCIANDQLYNAIVPVIGIVIILIWYYISCIVPDTCITLGRTLSNTGISYDTHVPCSWEAASKPAQTTQLANDTIKECTSARYVIQDNCPVPTQDHIEVVPGSYSLTLHPSGDIEVVYNTTMEGGIVSPSQSLWCGFLWHRVCIAPIQLPPLYPPSTHSQQEHDIYSQLYDAGTTFVAYGSGLIFPLVWTILGLLYQRGKRLKCSIWLGKQPCCISMNTCLDHNKFCCCFHHHPARTSTHNRHRTNSDIETV
jgi:hypothetical protein